jgi:hypothetical protein
MKASAKLEQEPAQHLSTEIAAWWRDVVATYELESHHLRLLQLACEAWDRAHSPPYHTPIPPCRRGVLRGAGSGRRGPLAGWHVRRERGVHWRARLSVHAEGGPQRAPRLVGASCLHASHSRPVDKCAM